MRLVKSCVRQRVAGALSGDQKGMLVAAICFVHCVAGPALLTFAGLASLTGGSEKLEYVFLLSSITFGAATLIPTYRTKHRRLSCLALFSCGLLCLLVHRFISWTAVPEMITVGVGATLIVGAHALNLKLSRKCQCCEPGVSTERQERADQIG
jgi:hypothetical protein